MFRSDRGQMFYLRRFISSKVGGGKKRKPYTRHVCYANTTRVRDFAGSPSGRAFRNSRYRSWTSGGLLISPSRRSMGVPRISIIYGVIDCFSTMSFVSHFSLRFRTFSVLRFFYRKNLNFISFLCRTNPSKK